MSEMKGTATVLVQAPRKLSEQKVVPARDRSFQPERSLVMRGFPKIPQYWVEGRSVLSCTGGRVTGRPDPTDVEIDVHSRFIAHNFDTLGGTWTPFLTQGVDYLMMSPPGLAPHIEQDEYRIGKEMLIRPCLWFNPGDHLITSFNQGIDDALSFSVVLAISPRTPAPYTIFSTTDDQTRLSVNVTPTGFSLSYGELENTHQSVRLLNTTPVYVALTCGPSEARLYVGSKASSLASVALRIPANEVKRMKFMIGKDHRGKAVSSFSLFEMLLVDHTMSKDEVYRKVSALSSIYGAL